ncbi:MAG: arginase family protein [Actinomycetota bacterium]|nr:arginase family protein [Actinomycetota bacterium]
MGRRDAEEASKAGSQRIENTLINVIDLVDVRRLGVRRVAGLALDVFEQPELDGFWIHLDCDVLDDAVMPAVDYRLPGGLSWQELEVVLRAACASPGAIGIDVTIYNPTLDPDRSIARRLVECLATALEAS